MATMAVGIGFCLVNAAIGGDYIQRNMGIRRAWIRFVSPFMGIRIEKRGAVPEGACLIIGNHRSFLDPMVALYYVCAWPLAKAEVSNYPLIGFGTRITGILFVQREDSNSRKGARLEIAQIFKRNESVLVYPEGTTNTGPTSMPFRLGSFQVASQYEVPVVPVAIEYADPRDHWGGTSLLKHYIRQVGRLRTRCTISFGPPIHSFDHLEVAEQAQQWIDDQLISFRAQYNSESRESTEG